MKGIIQCPEGLGETRCSREFFLWLPVLGGFNLGPWDWGTLSGVVCSIPGPEETSPIPVPVQRVCSSHSPLAVVWGVTFSTGRPPLCPQYTRSSRPWVPRTAPSCNCLPVWSHGLLLRAVSRAVKSWELSSLSPGGPGAVSPSVSRLSGTLSASLSCTAWS